MNKLHNIARIDSHAIAVEWSAPSLEELDQVLRNAATKRGIVKFTSTVFDAPTFSIDSARAIKVLQATKLSREEESVIIISSRSFLRDAQNALLKSLEEPTAGVRIILVTPSLSSLLETVLSRTAQVYIGPGDAAAVGSQFLKMDHKGRLKLIADVLKDDTKDERVRFLESLEEELGQTLAKGEGDQAALSQGSRRVLEAKRLMLSGSTSLKYVLEELALTLPRV